MKRALGAIGDVALKARGRRAVFAVGVGDQQQADRTPATEAGLVHDSGTRCAAEQCGVAESGANEIEDRVVVVQAIIERAHEIRRDGLRRVECGGQPRQCLIRR